MPSEKCFGILHPQLAGDELWKQRVAQGGEGARLFIALVNTLKDGADMLVVFLQESHRGYDLLVHVCEIAIQPRDGGVGPERRKIVSLQSVK